MLMGKKLLIALLVIMLCLRATDIYITYLITPDLSQEWNPLVSFFGHSWGGLLAVQIVLFMVAAFCAHKSVYHDAFSCYPIGFNYREFVYFHFNERTDPPRRWIAKFFKFPKVNRVSLTRHFAFICFVYFSTFISVSIFAIVNNSLIYYEMPAYMEFVYRYSNAYILGVFVVSIFINAQIYFYIGYSRYKRAGKF